MQEKVLAELKDIKRTLKKTGDYNDAINRLKHAFTYKYYKRAVDTALWNANIVSVADAMESNRNAIGDEINNDGDDWGLIEQCAADNECIQESIPSDCFDDRSVYTDTDCPDDPDGIKLHTMEAVDDVILSLTPKKELTTKQN